MVRAISVVGRTRSSIRVLNDSASAAQPPTAPGSDMRWRSRPSLPTVALRRVISLDIRSVWPIAWLNASAMRASDAGPVRRQPHREVAVAEGDHGGEQQLGSGVGRVEGVRPRRAVGEGTVLG